MNLICLSSKVFLNCANSSSNLAKNSSRDGMRNDICKSLLLTIGFCKFCVNGIKKNGSIVLEFDGLKDIGNAFWFDGLKEFGIVGDGGEFSLMLLDCEKIGRSGGWVLSVEPRI